MALGTSLFLIAVGAILHWAVTVSVSGVDLQTVGLILMIVGVVGLAASFLSLTLLTDHRRGDLPVRRDRDPY